MQTSKRTGKRAMYEHAAEKEERSQKQREKQIRLEPRRERHRAEHERTISRGGEGEVKVLRESALL